MGKSVRIWQKKQLIFNQLSFVHRDMVKIGTVGVAAVKNRLSAAQGPEDRAAKPLTKRYAIHKTRLGKGNRRTLSLTGRMLNNFSLRTVNENSAKAGLTSRKVLKVPRCPACSPLLARSSMSPDKTTVASAQG